MDNRKDYTAPALEVILFAAEDVIADSLTSGTDRLPVIQK